jgi:hypothetical protein
MDLSAWFIIVPFCLGSLITGIVQATFTKWGLFRHYWIVLKLFLTIGATALLLLHIQPISILAMAAQYPSFSNSQHAEQIINLATKAGAAIMLLLFTTTISVYKPWGKIQLAQNSNNQIINMQHNGEKTKKTWTFYALIGLIGLILIFVIMHLTGAMPGMHGH